MPKYPISREFYPYALFAPPIRSARVASFMGSFMGVPRWLFRDAGLTVRREKIGGFEQGEIEVLVMTPKGLGEGAPCLVYYHGGGFLFPAADYHYKLAAKYAKETPCKVVFVQYRLTPKHPFPIPVEDCYAALCWTLERAEELGISKDRVAVGGDSAGGALAAAVAQMARDRLGRRPLFQLLVYPVTDRRMGSDSNRQFTDTPMWNSKLSVKMWEAYLQAPPGELLAYASPLEADSFAELPPAYVETAQFDCLHDEGVDYAEALRAAGVEVTLNETEGTIHGFDTVWKAPTTQAAVAARIAYMKERMW